MNRANDNIHTASGVAQEKKVRVRALGRGPVRKVSYILPHKLIVTRNPSMHSLRVWKGECGSAQHPYSSWYQTSKSLHGQLKRHFTQCKRTGTGLEAEQNNLDIVGVSSTKGRGSDSVELNEGWKLFYSGVDVTMLLRLG